MNHFLYYLVIVNQNQSILIVILFFLEVIFIKIAFSVAIQAKYRLQNL